MSRITRLKCSMKYINPKALSPQISIDGSMRQYEYTKTISLAESILSIYTCNSLLHYYIEQFFIVILKIYYFSLNSIYKFPIII